MRLFVVFAANWFAARRAVDERSARGHSFADAQHCGERKRHAFERIGRKVQLGDGVLHADCFALFRHRREIYVSLADGAEKRLPRYSAMSQPAAFIQNVSGMNFTAEEVSAMSMS